MSDSIFPSKPHPADHHKYQEVTPSLIKLTYLLVNRHTLSDECGLRVRAIETRQGDHPSRWRRFPPSENEIWEGQRQLSCQQMVRVAAGPES